MNHDNHIRCPQQLAMVAGRRRPFHVHYEVDDECRVIEPTPVTRVVLEAPSLLGVVGGRFLRRVPWRHDVGDSVVVPPGLLDADPGGGVGGRLRGERGLLGDREAAWRREEVIVGRKIEIHSLPSYFTDISYLHNFS